MFAKKGFDYLTVDEVLLVVIVLGKRLGELSFEVEFAPVRWVQLVAPDKLWEVLFTQHWAEQHVGVQFELALVILHNW